jgi:glycosyltransferase involved in cell wall biosynthesis
MTAAAPVGAVVVVPAHDEQDRVATTVAAAARIPGIVAVVVCDDGSGDRTADAAIEAGARVVRHHRRRGKAAAMTTGAAEAARSGFPEVPLLFLDADLEDSAANAGPLVTPVLDGEVDMTIAVLPATGTGGGRGRVLRLAGTGIEQATGWRPSAPLSGQRCIRRDLFDAVQPLAAGFGVETGLTIDVLRRGGRVLECPVDLRHRVTGTSWADRRHRARQYAEVWRALAGRGVYRLR